MDNIKVEFNELEQDFINKPENAFLIENWEEQLYLPRVRVGWCPDGLYYHNLSKILAILAWMEYGIDPFIIQVFTKKEPPFIKVTIVMDITIKDEFLEIYKDISRFETVDEQTIRNYMLEEDKSSKAFFDNIISKAKMVIHQ